MRREARVGGGCAGGNRGAKGRRARGHGARSRTIRRAGPGAGNGHVGNGQHVPECGKVCLDGNRVARRWCTDWPTRMFQRKCVVQLREQVALVSPGCAHHADHGDSVGCFVSSHATTTSRSSPAKAASSLASLALTCPGASYSAVFRLARQVSR